MLIQTEKFKVGKQTVSVTLSRWSGIEIKVDDEVIVKKFIFSKLGNDVYTIKVGKRQKQELMIVMDFPPLWGIGIKVDCEAYLINKPIAIFKV